MEAFLPEQAQNGYLVRLFEVEPQPGSRPFREHRHSWFEIVLFKQGHGLYQTATAAYPIQAGDVFVFSSNEVHLIPKRRRPTHAADEPAFRPTLFSGSPYDGLSQMGVSFFTGHSPQFETAFCAARRPPSACGNCCCTSKKSSHKRNRNMRGPSAHPSRRF